MKYYQFAEKKISINLTSLIDIVFLIVIFFAVTSKFNTEREKTISLPESVEQKKAVTQERLIIEMDSARKVSVNEKIYTQEELNKYLEGYSGDKTRSVLLRIDRSVPHGFVISFLDLLKQHRFKEISFATEPSLSQ